MQKFACGYVELTYYKDHLKTLSELQGQKGRQCQCNISLKLPPFSHLYEWKLFVEVEQVTHGARYG